MKTSLVIGGLASLAVVVVLAGKPGGPRAASESILSGDSSFEVHVVKPRSNQPFFGLLPDGIFGLPPKSLWFDHTSAGARMGNAESDRLELTADGWNVSIEADDHGNVTAATRLEFSLELANRKVRLHCRPGDRVTGYLRTTARPGSGEIDGSFLVKLARCENAATGRDIEWPARPLTVRGQFQGLSQTRR